MNLFKAYLDKYNVSEVKKKIFINIYWALLGKVVSVLSGILVGVLVARYLGPAQFGLMNYVISYVTIFSVISTFGLDNIEIRELSKKESKSNIIIGTSICIRAFLGILTIILIVITIIIFESDENTFVLVIIYSSVIMFNSLNVIKNYFTSLVLNEYIVKSEIFRTIVGALIKIYLLCLHANLFWFIVSFVIDYLLIASGYLYAYKNKVGLIKNWRYDKKVAKNLLSESFPLLLSSAAVIVYQQIDQIMIRNMLNNNAIGYYSTAIKFTDLFFFMPVMISQTITPMLIREKESNYDRYVQNREKFVAIIVWISIIISVFVTIFAYWIIKYSFGIKYMQSVPVLQILIWKTVGMALSASSGQIIIIDGIQRYAVYRNLIGCFICIVLNIIFIPIYGVIGSAITALITVAFTGCIANIFIPPYHNIIKMQIYAIIFGWRDLLAIKKFYIK